MTRREPVYRKLQEKWSYHQWRWHLWMLDTKGWFRKKGAMQVAPRENGSARVFCISMQRNGTTSVGKFFRDFGFRWAGWPASRANEWSRCWYEGDYDAIFSSSDFLRANAFEDSPWFLPDFYKILFHRFPHAKFVLFTRDEDAWFRSMMSHSSGNVIGNSRVHSKVYRRELEFFEFLSAGAINEESENAARFGKLMKITTADADHYKRVYRLHNLEVQDFFKRHAPGALYSGMLDDPNKWQELGRFLEVDVPVDYDSHANKSRR